MRVVPPNGVASATILLDRPAPPSGLVVELRSEDPAIVVVSPSVSFQAGWIGATFEMVWVAVGSTSIVATLNGVEKTLAVAAQDDGGLSIAPESLQIDAVAFSIVPDDGTALFTSDAPERPTQAVSLVPEADSDYDGENTPEVGAVHLRPEIISASEE